MLCGPALVGMISELSGRGLKAGLFSAIVFPVILVAGIWMMNTRKQEEEESETIYYGAGCGDDE